MMNIKHQAANLWKDTFGDSDEYIGMIMDHYYDEKRCRCECHDGVLAASSVVIPYIFKKRISDPRECSVDGQLILDSKFSIAYYNGDYLCGLATRPELRGQGIMRRIIGDIEKDSEDLGHDFTFLIPADSRLREYYRRLGYEDTCPKTILILKTRFLKEEGMLNASDMEAAYNVRKASSDVAVSNVRNTVSEKSLSIVCLDSSNVDERIITDLVDRLMDEQACNCKEDSGYLYISHNRQQWEDVLRDFLREEGRIIIGKDNLNHSDEAGIFMTSNGKILPVFGNAEELICLLKYVINEKRVDLQKCECRLEIADPILATVLIDLLEGHPDLPGEIIVEKEKYGMAKILKKYSVAFSARNVSPEQIVIRFMLD